MEIPRHWRLRAQRYRLEGSVCPTCGQPSFPPRRVCAHCVAQPAQFAASGIMVLPALHRNAETDLLKGR
jgi:uncharacterized OB-fold protein